MIRETCWVGTNGVMPSSASMASCRKKCRKWRGSRIRIRKCRCDGFPSAIVGTVTGDGSLLGLLRHPDCSIFYCVFTSYCLYHHGQAVQEVILFVFGLLRTAHGRAGVVVSLLMAYWNRFACLSVRPSVHRSVRI